MFEAMLRGWEQQQSRLLARKTIGDRLSLVRRVLAPMLGLYVVTAQRWRQRAATDWSACLEAGLTAQPR
ncbi:hypothetical protein ABZ454_35630 [Streptomyces sp. NPDC005803]|uniref:hypothetical protein n=1 Tax=Streptomyces sp. NPDC005803 TaxID=3154297 RepID=UPI0033F4F5B8